MAKVRINYKLIIVLIIGLCLLAGSAIGLRKWFRSKTVTGGYTEGKKAYNQENWAKAAQQLGNYLAVRKDDIEILKMYAESQMNIRPIKQGNIQQAVSAYRQINRLDPNDVEAVRELTNIYFDMGAYNEVRSKAEEFLETNNDAEVRLMLSRSLIGLRRFEDAYKQLTTLTVENPGFIPAYELLATYSMRRPDKFKTAPETWYDKAIDNNPEKPMAYLIRAAWYRMVNQKQQALADLEKAQDLGGLEVDVMVRMGQEYILLGEYEKAKTILSQVENLEPENLNLWRANALVALASKDPNQITSTADQALVSLGYKNWDFLDLAAELYIEAKKYEKANEIINKLGTIEENRSKVLFLRGLIQNRKNNRKEAARLIREAVDLGYKTPRARITLAGAYAETGDINSGIQQLRALVNEAPDNFEAHLNLAKLLLQNNDPTGAADEAQQAMQLNPSNAEVLQIYIKAKSISLSRAGVSKDHPEWKVLEDKIKQFESNAGETEDIIFNKYRLALRQDNPKKAQQLLEQINKKHAQSVENYIAKSEMELYKDNKDKAKKILNQAIEKYPERGEPYSYLVQILFSEGNYDSCIETAQKAIENIESENSRLQMALAIADIAKSSRDKEKVIKILINAANDFSDSITLKRKLLSFEQIQNNQSKTKKLIEQIKNIEGEDGWQWKYEQAKFLYLSGQMEDGEQILDLLKEAVTTNPASIESRILMGTVYTEKNDLMAAISVYRQALNRWPDEPGIIVPLVSLLYRTNEYAEADKLLKSAADLKIEHPAFEKLQIHSLMRSGNYQAVSEMMQESLIKDPNDTNMKLSLALIYMREEKLDKAQKLIDQLQAMENKFAVEVAQIELLNRKGDYEKSMRLADDLVKKYDTPQAYLTRGRNLAMLGKDDLAEKDFLKVTELEPAKEDTWLTLINFYSKNDNKKAAIETAKKAIEKLPDNTKILKRAAILYGAYGGQENLEHSSDLIERALNISPDDPDLLLMKAKYLVSTMNPGRMEESAKILENLVESYPAMSQAWQMLASLELQKNNHQRALYYCDKGLAHSPGNTELILLKARTIVNTSPFSAVKILSDLLAQKPENLDVIIPLAQAHLQTGNAEEAIEMLKNKLKTAKQNDKRKLELMLGTAYEKNNQQESAEEIFKKLEEQSDDATLLYTRANLLIDQQKWAKLIELTSNWAARNKDKLGLCLTICRQLIVQDNINARSAAEDLLQRLLSLDTENIETLSNLGIVYQLNGKPQQSAKMYEQILKQQPKNIVAINNLSWILCENMGQFDRALQLANKGLELAPNYEDLYDTRGYIYYRTEKYNKALEDFKNALKLIPPGNPQAAGIYYHLGKVYAELGDSSKATENLNRAVTLDPNGEILSPEDISDIRRLLYRFRGSNL